MFTKKPLSAVIAVLLSVPTAQALELDLSDIERVEIKGQSQADPLMPFTLKSVENGKIYAGKKTTVVNLEDQPTFVEPNLRQVFSRLPGLFVSDQKIPSIYNVNYRGLGNPHESEFVAFFQDGVPLASDMFGYATIYYLPPAQRIEQVEFVRGGSGLLYGPQIGPTINLVTRRASAEADNGFRTEHSLGSDGFYSTYNEITYSNNDWGLMASFDRREADGPRQNEDYELNAGYLGVAYEGFDDISLGFDLDIYQSDSGEAGRLSSGEFAANRDLTLTPFNRIEIDRVIATFSYAQQLSNDATLDAKVWHSYQDRFSRRSGQFSNPDNEPATTNIDQQEFKTFGADVRYAQAWSDHIFTLGTTLYRDDSPRTRYVSSDIRSNAQRAEDLRFQQDRVMTYSAVFVENLFRFGDLSLVPTLRYERVNYDLFEPVKNPSLNRDAINIDQTNNELLFGLGAAYTLGSATEAYFNFSESYRPQRFDDLANPNAELAGENGPDISRAQNLELGIRSVPATGLSVDVSLFRVDFEDKIEQIQVNISDIERINTGDSLHQGIEFSVEYDLLASSNTVAIDDTSLILFANGSLLDAEIKTSVNSALEGNTPAFAPDYLMRAGVLYNNDALSAALTATLVDSQYWQDSNAPRGTGFDEIAAQIPSYQVLDFSLDYTLSESWTVFGGINNMLNENYYSRVRNDGIEPAMERTFFVGFRFEG